MKIVLFRGGKRGVVAKLPGDAPEMELTDLLGGEVEYTVLGHGLRLVSLTHGEEMQLPIRYAVRRLGRAPMPVAGDCAVVHMRVDGILRDVNATQIEAASDYVRGMRV